MLCKDVAEGKEKKKQMPIKLKEQIQNSFSESKIEEVTKRFSREDTYVLANKRRTNANHRKQNVFTLSPSMQVLINHLPSIRRLVRVFRMWRFWDTDHKSSICCSISDQ